MATQDYTDYLFRVGDGENFWRSSNLHTWATNRNHGFRDIIVKDRMWFISNGEGKQIIAVASFVRKNERRRTNEEMGWVGDEEWAHEIHYKNLYDLRELNLLSKIKGQCNVRKYNENCEVNLPIEYELIKKYSQAVYIQ
tara:strand:- start:121 stop:537 length:417 start_codon:yes stop_codon:yes gene_type:complete